ncbi:MAG TPA: hypothetical protein VJP79_00335 [Nitrososphaera sp.]|nr:hypothetical protein [Nitrososphaera sp.]
MEFIDADDGSIIVPKPVRPVVGLKETLLGGKKGAMKQYRYGNLHVREYDTHYAVHMDRVDPLKNPFGHLVIDAPEYIAGVAAAAYVAKCVGTAVYQKRKRDGKTRRDAAIEAAVAGYIAGSAAGKIVHAAASSVKKKRGK